MDILDEDPLLVNLKFCMVNLRSLFPLLATTIQV